MFTYVEMSEECLANARNAEQRDAPEAAMYWLARAQVYATLALMAETRDK